MRKKIILAVFALLLLALPVMAEDVNQVVAIVKGQEVTLGKLDEVSNMQQFLMDIYDMNPQFTELLFSTESGQKLLNEYRKVQLEQYISHLLLVMEAKSRGFVLTEDKINQIFNQQVQQILAENNITMDQLIAALQQQGVESLEQYKQIFVEQNSDYMLLQELQNQLFSTVVVDDAEAQNYYKANQQDFASEAAVRARHILTDKKEKAEEALAELKKGADFVEMVKKYSAGPSVEKGGDLGFFSKGETLPEFEDAAFALKAGEISGIVQTQFGYHIIKVEEVRPAGVTPFDEVKEEIRENLLLQKKDLVWKKFVEDLRKNSAVEIKL